jgi:hypothetical protein
MLDVQMGNRQSVGGQLQMESQAVLGRWVQVHVMTHWMTILVITIGGRRRTSVRKLSLLCQLCGLINATGGSFLRKAEEAIKAREEYVEAFIEFDAALPTDLTTSWMKACQEWESDREMPNPFEMPKNGKVIDV